MNFLGLTLLLGNLVVAPVIMMVSRSVRAVVFAAAVGYVVLSPRAGVNIPGLPKFTKDAAISYGLLIGLALFRADLVRRFRPRWIDAFFVVAMCSPFVSSVTNGLGAWDGMSEFYGRMMTWGVPYLVGRMLIHSPEDVREFAIAVLLTGMAIVPLCLIEIRLSPQIHRWVYGVHATAFHMSIRLGGYRPTLMFRHGIEVGSCLACSTIIGVWFSLAARGVRPLGVPVRLHTAVIFFVSVISRSLGALILLFGSTGVAAFTRFSRLKIALLALALATPTYLAMRITGVWSPDFAVAIVEELVDPSRARSFAARIYQEQELGGKAKLRLPFGWGGHNRFRVFDDYGEATTVVDSLWLITFGKYGLVGLVGLYGMLCVPSILIVRRTPARYLLHARMAGVVGLILALAIANADSLQNAFYSPLMMMASGALATTAVSVRAWLPKDPRRTGQAAGAPTPPPGAAPDRVAAAPIS